MRIGVAHAESAIHRLACACQQKATSYRVIDAKIFMRRPLRCIRATHSSRTSLVSAEAAVVMVRRMMVRSWKRKRRMSTAVTAPTALHVAMNRATPRSSRRPTLTSTTSDRTCATLVMPTQVTQASRHACNGGPARRTTRDVPAQRNRFSPCQHTQKKPPRHRCRGGCLQQAGPVQRLSIGTNGTFSGPV